MTRFLFALLLVPAVGAPSFAQDMPLSQILIAGEGWQKVPVTEAPLRTAARVETRSADRGTRFLLLEGSAFIWAESIREGGRVDFRPAPYAPLRTKRGAKTILVTGLATDREGRIYAATEIGVQVFDPTGRLCGVLTPAAEGTPDRLAFEGDRLTLWVGKDKYARKLNTAAP